MKSQKIRDVDTHELGVQLRDIDEQLFRLRLQMSMGQMDGLKKIRAMKKDARAHPHDSQGTRNGGVGDSRGEKVGYGPRDVRQ